MPRMAIQLIAAGLLISLPLASALRAAGERTFATPDEAVRALIETAAAGEVDVLLAIFGAEGREILASSDPVTARNNRDLFVVAAREQWRLVDTAAGAKELVIGNEEWPFPVPLVKDGARWRFDTAAGREEILDRRIGRNELSVIRVCQAYVAAQRAYASTAHDGKQAGLYARQFNSDAGKENGLYWPGRRSPLGDLVADAAADRRADGGKRAPFHGYYFRILEKQGPAAPGNAVDYVVNGEMTRGFALVAWPAQYEASGIMTFVVNHDGVVYEQDLGPETEARAGAITAFDPDSLWRKAQADVDAAP
jgi:hypothetical protein